MTSVDTPAPKAGRREWLGLAVLALPTLLVAFDIFVLLLALPHLTIDLHANGNQQLWITDMYGFLLAGFLLTMGNLGDRIGRRKLLLIGASVFGAASICAAYSTSPEMLIACRAVLGVAGATLAPSTLALISNIFHNPKERAMAIGIWGGTWTIGAIIGPIVGGVLLAHFWWGSVFLLGVPAMVLLLILGPVLLPEYRNPKAGRLDPLSVALSLVTLLPAIWGIKQLARNGWELLPSLAVVVGVVFGVLFFRRQRRLDDPLLDPKLFHNRAFNTSLGGLLGYSFVGGSTMFFMNQYFQLVAGFSTVKAGLASVPGAIAGTIAFGIAPVLAKKIRPAYVIAGSLVGAIVMILLITQASGAGDATMLIIGFAGFSFFGVPLVALGTNLVVSSAPPEKGGTVGSMTQLSNEFGATLGAAIMGTIGFAVYRHEIDVPSNVPSGVARSVNDSMAGAAEGARSLVGQVRDQVLDSARDAFASGMHVVIIINAVILGVIGVLVATMLRHVAPIGKEQPGSPSAAPAAPAETAQSPELPPVAAEPVRE